MLFAFATSGRRAAGAWWRWQATRATPAVFYFGAVAGGVWKTEDAGTTWRCISDGYFKTGSVGALCVPDAAPNIIYAGMGETTIRTDVSHGDGVYKSTDGGRTWQHLGLADTRHIGRVRVHPRNPDIVYVAALGHAFGTNDERGVFRSRNGGVTWEKVLFKSERAGAVDLSIDEQNPDIIYASIWQTYRNFWELSSGGPDSGLWRSLDGGDTWEEISLNQGFPQSLKGKIGVAASPVKAGPRLGHRRGEGRLRPLPLRRLWRDLAEAHRQLRPALPPLVLHAHLRRPAGRGYGLRAQPGHAQVH
jgi:photosystem II stability/assembly factor-like uncharacterized protein